MTDSSNPAEGTASLTAEEAESKISALLFNDEPEGDDAPAVEAEVPSHEDADATEEQPETDLSEEEQPTEDAGSEEAEAPTIRAPNRTGTDRVCGRWS